MGLIQMFYMTDIVFSDFVIYVPFFYLTLLFMSHWVLIKFSNISESWFDT